MNSLIKKEEIMLINFFNLILSNDIQTYFYIFAICYMASNVFIKLWNCLVLHKRKDKC